VLGTCATAELSEPCGKWRVLATRYTPGTTNPAWPPADQPRPDPQEKAEQPVWALFFAVVRGFLFLVFLLPWFFFFFFLQVNTFVVGPTARCIFGEGDAR